MELRERHRLFVDIMKLATRLGVEFAFPTRTLHLFQEEHSDGGLVKDWSAPLLAGQQQAERIAGPLLTGDQRPGRVKYTGPTPVESDERGESETDDSS
jgi:MscS family membrane protein